MSTPAVRTVRILAVVAVILGVALAVYPAYLVIRSGPTPEGLVQILVCVALIVAGVVTLRRVRPRNRVEN